MNDFFYKIESSDPTETMLVGEGNVKYKLETRSQ